METSLSRGDVLGRISVNVLPMSEGQGVASSNLASPTIYSAGPRSGAHQTLGLAAWPSEALFPKWETSAIADTVAIGVVITTETWVMLGVSRIELVHQALSVRLDPALYSLAGLHPEDLYPRRRNKPTAGGFAHELALVRSSICPTYDYPVSLCDDILHRCDEVREGRAVDDHTPAIVVGTLYREIQRVMADEFIR